MVLIWETIKRTIETVELEMVRVRPVHNLMELNKVCNKIQLKIKRRTLQPKIIAVRSAHKRMLDRIKPLPKRWVRAIACGFPVEALLVVIVWHKVHVQFVPTRRLVACIKTVYARSPRCLDIRHDEILMTILTDKKL